MFFPPRIFLGILPRLMCGHLPSMVRTREEFLYIPNKESCHLPNDQRGFVYFIPRGSFFLFLESFDRHL